MGADDGRLDRLLRINRARLDPVTLILVAECVRTGSLTDAARRCHASVSAASRRVALLEAALGLELFERHRRGLRATEAARVVARAAAHVTHAIEQMEEALQRPRISLHAS
jgi:DNA-binding transcriptional LysR family regulator